jgi:hypothetical protein
MASPGKRLRRRHSDATGRSCNQNS